MRPARLLALAAVLLTATTVPVQTTAAQTTDDWRAVRSPDLKVFYELRGVVATGDGNAVAVGTKFQDTAVVLRGNGERWNLDRRFPTRSGPNVAEHLFSVDALGPDNVCAVGSTDFRPIAAHFDGTRWQGIPGLVSPEGSEFLDVTIASPSQVWAVANDLVIPQLSPQAQRWDGAQWTRFDLPHPFDVFVQVNAIESLGPNDVWAVGSGRSGPTLDLLPIAWHWDGTAWSYVLMPRLGALQVAPLDLVAVSPTELFMVGQKLVRLDDPGNLPAVERWDGTAWREVTGPDVPPGAFPHAVLSAVAPDGQGGIWAAGLTLAPEFVEPSFTSYFAHFSNGTWTVQIEPGGLQGEIRGLTQVPGSTSLWAVGVTRDDVGGCGPCQGLIGLFGPSPR